MPTFSLFWFSVPAAISLAGVFILRERQYLRKIRQDEADKILQVTIRFAPSDLYSAKVQIEIHNKSQEAAQNVALEFMSIDPKPTQFSGERFPVRIAPINCDTHIINPDCKIYYDFFTLESQAQARLVTFSTGASFSESFGDMLKKTASNEFTKEYHLQYPSMKKESDDGAYLLKIRISSMNRIAVEKTIRLRFIPTYEDAFNTRPLFGGYYISCAS